MLRGIKIISESFFKRLKQNLYHLDAGRIFHVSASNSFRKLMYQSFACVEVYSKWKVLKLQYEKMFWMEAAEGIPGNSAIIVEYSQL